MLTAYVICLAVGGGFLALSFFGDFLEGDADFGADLDVGADADASRTAASRSSSPSGPRSTRSSASAPPGRCFTFCGAAASRF